MRHQLSYSVYQDLSVFGDDPSASLRSMGCDSLEMLTSYDTPDASLKGLIGSVHLPYAPDWLAAWEDRPVEMPPDYALYHMFGSSREELVANVRRAVAAASVLDPPYGVFHAGNADTPEIFRRTYSRSDSDVLSALCEMLNTVVSGLPGGEPPFELMLENLWWPGLRLLDPSGFRRLERDLEFERWGINLDTGHLMDCLPVSTEAEAIDALLDVFDGYPSDMIESIRAVHLHWSATWPYRSSFEERGYEPPFEEFIVEANRHVSQMDRHLPFSDPRCRELVDVLRPDFITHELPGSERGMIEDLSKQRALLPRSDPCPCPSTARRSALCNSLLYVLQILGSRGIRNGTLQRGRAQAPRQDCLHELLRHQPQEG